MNVFIPCPIDEIPNDGKYYFCVHKFGYNVFAKRVDSDFMPPMLCYNNEGTMQRLENFTHYLVDFELPSEEEIKAACDEFYLSNPANVDDTREISNFEAGINHITNILKQGKK